MRCGILKSLHMYINFLKNISDEISSNKLQITFYSENYGNKQNITVKIIIYIK